MIGTIRSQFELIGKMNHLENDLKLKCAEYEKLVLVCNALEIESAKLKTENKEILVRVDEKIAELTQCKFDMQELSTKLLETDAELTHIKAKSLELEQSDSAMKITIDGLNTLLVETERIASSRLIELEASNIAIENLKMSSAQESEDKQNEIESKVGELKELQTTLVESKLTIQKLESDFQYLESQLEMVNQQNTALSDIKSQLNEFQAKLLEPIVLNDGEIGKISNGLGDKLKAMLKEEINGLSALIGTISTSTEQNEPKLLQLKVSELEKEKLALHHKVTIINSMSWKLVL